MKTILIIIFASLLCLEGSEEVVEIGVFYEPWSPNLTSKIRVDQDEVEGAEFSLDDVGINEKFQPAIFSLKTTLWKRHDFNLSFYPLSYSGQIVLDEEIRFKGETYEINDTINSEFSLNLVQFGYTFFPLMIKGFKAGLGVTGNQGKVKAHIEDTTLGESRDYERSSLLPTIFLDLGYKYKIAEAKFRVGSFFKTEWGSILQAEMYGLIKPIPSFEYLGLGIGIKHFQMEWNLDESDGKVEMTGGFFIISSSFTL
ncbi:MAG: hypothetical protein JXA60_05715 [Candidatus Coatesbacteria bacterium]|nr:hypothetical protein [Candidatus Coatesbacteria bacterium]